MSIVNLVVMLYNKIYREVISMSKINKITPLTNVKFLNLYELEAENKFGDTHPYYVASRKNEI